MKALGEFLDRYAILIPLTVLLMMLGSWIKSDQIADSCGHSGTFKHNGIYYACKEIK